MTAKPRAREELSERDREIWAKFDIEIQKGLDDLERGELKEANEVFDRLEAKYAAMGQRRA